MAGILDKAVGWHALGRQYLIRTAVHGLVVVALWTVILIHDELKLTSVSFSVSTLIAQITQHWSHFAQDVRPAFWPGLLTLNCFALGWSSLSSALPMSVSLIFCSFSTALGVLFARFPIPERASKWLVWMGPDTPRLTQLSLIIVAGVFSLGLLMVRMTKQYESLNRDRIVLSPSEEDLAIRALVQSFVLSVLVMLGALFLWHVGDFRPAPAIAAADSRDSRPPVLFLAVDSEEHAKLIRGRLGEPFFKSWVIFGSPQTGAKFDEVLQCRYPIRLIGLTNSQSEGTRGASDFFVPAALESNGYSVSLLHASSPGESTEALKMLSRQFAHVRFLRRFGLLLPSRVFYTPDVQLSQIREALGVAVGRGKPAFLTASLLSREGRVQTKEDVSQFATFLDALSNQNWLRNIVIVLLEFPSGLQDKSLTDLSVAKTSAHVSFWATGHLADSVLIQSPPKLVRGIDLGASIAARLRLSSVVSQCDGVALFDISERPSVFQRDLVYQEVELPVGQDVFRKRGWLTSDGYRLELQESFDGVSSRIFKFGNTLATDSRSWESMKEELVNDPPITLELNRQLEDFLRSTGVEILSLGNGRTAYSEPFRRIRMLDP